MSEGLRLVTDYFAALSQRDLAGLARNLHFPFAVYEVTHHDRSNSVRR